MDINEIIGGFKTHLEKNLSKVTVKNYVSDINHFLSWIANNYPHINSVDLLTKNEFDRYISVFGGTMTPQTLNETHSHEKLSHTSFKRHVSSLKSFSAYLLSAGKLPDDPFMIATPEKKFDPWGIAEFKTYLTENKAGHLTIKYYINDIKAYKKWCEETNLDTVFKTDGPAFLSEDLVNEYALRLRTTAFLSPKSINRKLSSLRRYAKFLELKLDNKKIIQIPLDDTQEVKIQELVATASSPTYSKFPPLSLLQRSVEPYLLFEKKVSEVISSRLISMRMGTLTKQQSKKYLPHGGLRVKNISKEFYAPYDMSLNLLPLHKKIIHHIKYTRPKWYKTYHTYPLVHYVHLGVLILFALFASTFLYNQTLGRAAAQNTSAVNTLAVSRTFTFQGKLTGKDGTPITQSSDIRLSLYDSPTGSGSAQRWEEVQTSIQPDENGLFSLIIGSVKNIPEDLFADNMPIYLGITVNDGNELKPRKQVGASFAQNSEKLNGLSLITNSDKQTNVVLALDASGNLFMGGASDHTFQASGDFNLSGKTLILSTNPGSSGNVVFSPDGNGKIDLQKPITNTLGAVRTEGAFEITATTSASPALSINQDSAGNLISASTAGSTKFVVNNQGIITKGIWGGEVLGTQFGGFGADISATGAGEILYSTGTKTYGHLIAGKTGDCLTSNGKAAPSWSACGFLSQLNGAAILSNNSLDFLLGSSSTSSAKFAFINMSSSNPVFKIGGGLSFSSDNGIEALDKDLKIGGSSTKNIIVNTSSRVGIRNTNPERDFDVTGNWGGNVDYASDGAGDRTIERNTKALIYDLEKNTGTDNSSTSTIYNIVGLPNINGTIGYIYTKVEKGVTLNPQTQTIDIRINNSPISAVSTDGNASTDMAVKHFMVTRTNNSWHLMGDPGISDNADLAEWTEFEGSMPIPGDIVSISESGKLIKTALPYDKRIAGVISTKPNITIGKQDKNAVRLALSGRVPAIITSINGSVLSGDTITSSPINGAGMKTTRSGGSVGKALESFNPTISKCIESTSQSDISWPADNGKNEGKPCFKIKVSNLSEELQREMLNTYGLSYSDYIYIGKVMMLTNLSWSDSDDLLTSLQNVTVTSDEHTPPLDMDLASMITSLQEISPVVKVGSKTVEKIITASAGAVGKLNAGTVTALQIGTKNLIASRGIIGDLTVKTLNITDSLTINGLSLKDYIANSFKNQKEITSPLATLSTVKTDTIKANNSNKVVVELPQASDSALVVKNSTTGKDAIVLSAEGDITALNATLSGSLNSNSVNTTDATVSGTLRAQTVIAGNISGLDDKVTSITNQLLAKNTPQQNIPLTINDSSLNQASISANFGTFYEGLLSLGASTFGNLSVMDQLSIGTTLAFSPNSINTLGIDLEIQPLRQGGISFLAGAVKISIDGRLLVSEDALFKKNVKIEGSLSAHILSPLPNQDLSVNLNSDASDSSKFTVTNASRSAVLAVSSKGDLQASGSARFDGDLNARRGTFSKLKFNLVGQAIASGLNQATATGSAGTAILSANTTELTILNPNVTAESLIYITPAKETQNQVLFLMRQSDKTSFTIGVSQKIPQDVVFNWLIVN